MNRHSTKRGAPAKARLLLCNAADARDELYGLLDEMEADKKHHIEAWGDEHHASPKDDRGNCVICEAWDCRMQGIKRALRHFGGRPRY